MKTERKVYMDESMIKVALLCANSGIDMPPKEGLILSELKGFNNVEGLYSKESYAGLEVQSMSFGGITLGRV